MMIGALLSHTLTFASFCASHPYPPPVPVWPGDPAAAIQDDSKLPQSFLSKDQRDLFVIFKEPQRADLIVRKVPLNLRFTPRVGVRTTAGQKGAYRYVYSVTNAAGSQDPICAISIVASPEIQSHNVTYTANGPAAGWLGSAAFALIARQGEITSNKLGKYAGWSVRGTDEVAPSIKPGTTNSAFEIESMLLPGYTTMYLAGKQIDPALVDNADISAVEPITADFRFRTLSVLTFGPMFDPNTPRSAIVDNYLSGLKRLSQCPEYGVRPQLVNELSRILQNPQDLIDAQVAGISVPSPTDMERELLSNLRLVMRSKTGTDQ